MGKKKPTEEVCVKEMKACAADKECSLLHYKLQHYKLQEAKKGGKDGDYGGKGGDGKYDDKKEGGYGGNDGDKKKDDDGGDYGKGKKGRQLHQHEKGGDGDKKSTEKKDMGSKYEKKENEKDYGKKDDEKKDDDKYGDKKDMDKKDKEPSAELKAAMKACTENKLCKELMECMKEHTESGGKGDGKGDHDHGKGGCADFSEKECEAQKKLPCSWDDGKCAMKKKPTEEVCVEEAKACAADEECSALHAKLLHYKLQEAKKGGKDGGYGGKGGDGKYDDKKEGGYGGNDDKKESYNKGDKKGRQL